MEKIPAIYILLGGVSGALLGASIGLALYRHDPAKHARWTWVVCAALMCPLGAALAARVAVGAWIVGIPLLLLIGAAPVLLWAGVGVLVAVLIGRR